MPRCKSIPRYSLHRPSGQARVIINGRHIYLGPYDSAESRRAYAKALTDHVQSITPPPTPADGRPTFDLLISELLVKYLEYATRYYTVDGKASRELANIRYALVPLRFRLSGGDGRDTLHGNGGNDTLVSNDGSIDELFGDGGSDTATADDDDLLNSIETT